MKTLYTLWAALFMLTVSSVNAQLENGSIAPDWTLTDINGTEHNLQQYLDDGYSVVIDFSATWCGPCWTYHNSGALEDLYINHGPAGMENVSAETTDDVMVLMIEGDGNTTSDMLNGIGAGTQGDWVTGTPYPIIDSDEITESYNINFWPTIYTVCPNGDINVTGQLPAESHYELAYECQIASLDVQLEDNEDSSVQTGGESNNFFLGFSNTAESGEELLEVTVTTDAPGDWSAQISYDGTSSTTSLEINAQALEDYSVALQVTPGSTAALGNYRISIASLTFPDNPVIFRDYYVISGITDLVVDNGGVATAMNPDFLAGLEAAGNTTHAALGIDKFIEAMGDNQLTEVGHVYYNVAWTFPSFTNEGVEALTAFMDAGGNVMVMGQDVAWDTFNNEGTAITQAFLNDRLGVDYVGDGSGADNEMTFVSEDPLFGALGSSDIVNIHGGLNIYPDQIEPLGGSFPILYYGANENKIGGTRLQTDLNKVVYVGVDIPMIDDLTVRTTLVEITHDWFHGLVSNIEDSEAQLIGNMYPNPANGSVTIPFNNLKEAAELNIYNVLGELVETVTLKNGMSSVTLDLSNYTSGIYTVSIISNAAVFPGKILEIIK